MAEYRTVLGKVCEGFQLWFLWIQAGMSVLVRELTLVVVSVPG